jgi:hypothetical protein
LVLKEKESNLQDNIIDKQLDYYKSRNKIANEIQMNMVRAITNLIDIMHLIIKGDKNKEQIFQIMTLMIRTKKMDNKNGQIEV